MNCSSDVVTIDKSLVSFLDTQFPPPTNWAVKLQEILCSLGITEIPTISGIAYLSGLGFPTVARGDLPDGVVKELGDLTHAVIFGGSNASFRLHAVAPVKTD